MAAGLQPPADADHRVNVAVAADRMKQDVHDGVTGGAPGFLHTVITGGLGADGREAIVRRSALRRMPEVEDVARMVAFLLGEGGRNVTGTVMTVDAGNTA